MKIALLGANGTIGSRIANEALSRGHQITAVVRDAAKVVEEPASPATGGARTGGALVDRRINAVIGDATRADSLARVLKGHDAVVSAIGPGHGAAPSMLSDVAKALIEALPKAGVKRVLVVGGAGSLEVKPGVQLVDTPTFPASWKPVALAHRDALQVWRKNASLDWTCVSPAAMIAPGARTGKYRAGGDQLLVDARGESRITAEDFAIAVVDELEKPKHVRKRFTAAY